MIIADASAIVETLIDPTSSEARQLLRSGELHAPDVVGLEVLQALRGLVRGGRLSQTRGAEAVEDFSAWPMFRHRHRRLEARVWALRDRMSAYDAAYVALAEMLDLPLVTADRRLARAADGLVELVVPSG